MTDRRALLAALAVASLVTGCADTVSPTLGGLKIGMQDAPLRPPSRVDSVHPFEYPERAWAEGASGTTVLRLLISPAGTVDSVLVIGSSGNAALDSAALANSRKLRYSPARQGDQPVAIWGRLPVIYPQPGEAHDREP